MHIRNVDLNLVAVFDAIMSEGSLSLAGKSLGMSQSAVSHALARLRAITGDELFVRTGRGVAATPYALQLAEPLRSAIDLMQQAFARGKDDEARPCEPERRFVIDLPVGFDLVFVPPLLAAADKAGLAGNFRIHNDRAGDLGSNLRYGETELALDLEVPSAKGLRWTALYEDDFLVCGRKGHPAFDGGLSESAYLAARHVTLTWTRVAQGSPVDDRLGALGHDRNVTLAMPTLFGCASAVAATDLLFTIHRRIANVLAGRFDLEVRPVPLPLARVTLYQIWHEGSEGDPGHRWLRGALSEISRTL